MAACQRNQDPHLSGVPCELSNRIRPNIFAPESAATGWIVRVIVPGTAVLFAILHRAFCMLECASDIVLRPGKAVADPYG